MVLPGFVVSILERSKVIWRKPLDRLKGGHMLNYGNENLPGRQEMVGQSCRRRCWMPSVAMRFISGYYYPGLPRGEDVSMRHKESSEKVQATGNKAKLKGRFMDAAKGRELLYYKLTTAGDA